MEEILPQVPKLSGSLMNKTHEDQTQFFYRKRMHLKNSIKQTINQFNKKCFNLSQHRHHVMQKNIRVEIK